jgi:hypothetical protein
MNLNDEFLRRRAQVTRRADMLEVEITPVGCHPELRRKVHEILVRAFKVAEQEVEEYQRLGLASWDPKENPNPVLPDDECSCGHSRRDHMALDERESKCFGEDDRVFCECENFVKSIE